MSLFKNVLSRITLATALRDIWQVGYCWRDFHADLMASLTVSVIAIPIAMALGIASGLSPQQGLYTAIIAGPIVALLGGTRLSVTGPTAAFVALLYPIVQNYGVTGLLLATFMAGIILVVFGILRLGRWIERVPYTTVVGFTAGIGIVIVSLQVKDFFGLSIQNQPANFIERLSLLMKSLDSLNVGDTLIGFMTILAMVIWRQFKTKIPPHIIAVLVSVGFAFTLKWYYPELTFETIATRFNEIPNTLPRFALPWQDVDLTRITGVLGYAFAIAILCAIESLLCAMILDELTHKKHHSNTELIAQGLGNIAVSCFGGIASTSAIARSIANYRAGGLSPFSSTLHGIIILLVILFFAPYFSYLPMATLAGLLLVIAWNISDIATCSKIIRFGSKSDVAILLVSCLLTIIFGMIIGVGAGLLLAILCNQFRFNMRFANNRLIEHPVIP